MYEVTYTGVSSVNPVPDSFFQPLYITISAANTSLVLQHLVPYSNYTILVRAFTSVGPGKYSEGIEDRTEEDGECLFNYNLLNSHLGSALEEHTKTAIPCTNLQAISGAKLNRCLYIFFTL